MRITTWLIIFVVLSSCKVEHKKLFNLLPAAKTGIDFTNELTLTKDFDVFRYRNYYNGGGVAIGDINNDSLPDVYLTANMKSNKLFLNKGNFEFEDITEAAGVGGSKIWSTGVSMADINGDGLLDIYVCNSGDVKGGRRENELFINQGNGTFTEQAAAYGLDDKGFSTHAVFFDYDLDGDLDTYVLNNSFRPVSTLGYENIRHERDSTGGDKLYRNDNNHFVDVSDQAGIYGSVIGFGLGVTITDVNQDGWLDIYVSNDFFERDYLYVNQQDGTFADELPERMGHISHFSMGADAADLNNDGYPEIFVTDMMPATDRRLKTMTNFESYDVHQRKLANDYYEQYMRNTLQLNGPDGTFREIGQLAGVEATDWSWGVLIADFDNDSHKEIFVSNGIYKDVTDQDFIAYIGSDKAILTAMRKESIDFQELVDRMPSTRLSNYLFHQDSSLSYHNVSADWGLDEPSFSNGAAYGDLDNDGDLDLVVNNVNQEVFVYQNNTDQLKKSHYLKVSFRGPKQNRFGVGARVYAYTGTEQRMLENVPTKGFQSSVDYTMVIGLDSLVTVDSLTVHWGYDQKVQTLYNVSADQTLMLDIAEAVPASKDSTAEVRSVFQAKQVTLTPAYQHQEDAFVDFDYERLTYHMLSREGPALAVADVNQDGLDDFYIGGAAGKAGRVYVQTNTGNFRAIHCPSLDADSLQEDVDALFFDADGDQDLDLYVVSGGNAFREGAREYQDRLYLLTGRQNGQPLYEKREGTLPRLAAMGACVASADYDQDGDQDLFVGSRAVPLRYGLPASSYILENDGQGVFSDVTGRVSPRLNSLGMVTDASWVDIDNDDDQDLVVVGDWMPITIFKNNGANLERLNNVPGLTQSEGWWRSVAAQDLNGDGETDLVVGNWGRNSRFQATPEHPLELYVSDFDDNQTIDQVFAYYQGDSLFPVALRHDLLKQLNSLKKQFVHYQDYAGKTMSEIFSAQQLEKAVVNKVYRLESSAVMNNGDGSYTLVDLPEEAQFSPVYALASDRFGPGGATEWIVAGNFSGVKPEEGRYDANHGLLLKQEAGRLVTADQSTGLHIQGDVRKLATAQSVGGKKLLIVARNNQTPEFYEYESPSQEGTTDTAE